jgi:DnaK suppressor protein
MTNAETKRLEAALHAKRLELIRELRGHAERLTIHASEPDLIDCMQSMAARDETAILLNRFSSTLADVDRSLRAVTEGCYGVCAECGEPIGIKRLQTIPWAAYCVRCQEQFEAADARLAA